MNLEEIVNELNERKQRATYGAIAGIHGVSSRGLMAGRPRNPTYCWVVAASGPGRGWPTDYTFEQTHPDCLQQIRSGFENNRGLGQIGRVASLAASRLKRMMEHPNTKL